MKVIDYFRILKGFKICFHKYVQNQNEEVLGEMLVGSDSDNVKTRLRDLHNFQNGHLPFPSF